MNTIKKLGYSTLGLACLYIAYITGTGDILNYISFTDRLGEMALCICAIIMSIFCFVSAFSSDKVLCSKELDMEWANESENIQ